MNNFVICRENDDRKQNLSKLEEEVCFVAMSVRVGLFYILTLIASLTTFQFRTLSEASEALFSLVNGDDMFATFYTLNGSNSLIKIVGTVYIYTFVSLFIYVVLSLFIAIIMDAYEIVKVSYFELLV